MVPSRGSDAGGHIRPGVLITRPEDQVEELSFLVEQAGARPVPFPLLRIEPVDPDPSLLTEARLRGYRIFIFVSRNAVRLGAPLLGMTRGALPADVLVLAVGAATSRELASLGIAVRHPGRSDSEGLLEMEETREVGGSEILIVRGVGGRETLGETLARRGARVHYLEVYRRIPSSWTPEDLEALLFREGVDLVTITSAENLEHFHRLFSALEDVTAPAILLSSKRLTDLARGLGYENVHTAEGAENSRMAAAVARWVALA